MAKQKKRKTRKQKEAENKYLTCKSEKMPRELIEALNEMEDDSDS